MAAISMTSRRVSGSASSSLMTIPVRTKTRIPAICDRMASSGRDDERRPVGAKEGEQAHERAPARRSVGLRLVCGHGPRRVRIVLEAVPNVSEGRDRAVVDAIGRAFGTGATVLDVHVDPDHHRSVFTLVGDRASLVDALLAGVSTAIARIDLRAHEGVHPRVGVVDVVPLVPLVPGEIGTRRGCGASGRGPGRVGARAPGLSLRHHRRRDGAPRTFGAAASRPYRDAWRRVSLHPPRVRA